MNPVTKIVIGALATTAVAWFLHGPMKFGEKCAANASAPIVAAPVPTAGVAEAPATVEAIANCQTKVDGVITGKTINFVTGGAAIAPDSLALIESLATELKACAGTSVEVAGHTDVTGGTAANQRLSEERANSVVSALVERGVPTARLLPKGLGETAPLDPAMNAAAHAKNRRIEFKVAATSAAPAAAGQ
jgi:outer membrane protein OmpA-like peptidoglycan-associated protein